MISTLSFITSLANILMVMDNIFSQSCVDVTDPCFQQQLSTTVFEFSVLSLVISI